MSINKFSVVIKFTVKKANRLQLWKFLKEIHRRIFDFIAVFLKVALQIAKSAQHCVLHWCIFFPVFEIAQDYLPQARIHTGFHGFTEIGQIFHNKCIQFLVKKL